MLEDAVYPGFSFEIKEELNEETPLIWLHNYWGHVQFDNICGELCDPMGEMIYD